MAEFSTLVSAVHAVYRSNGGAYEEGTAPELMQVAASVRRDRTQQVRRLEDTTEAVRNALEDDIVTELRRRSR